MTRRQDEQQARVIDHPDDLIPGRKYRVTFYNSHRKYRCARVIFHDLVVVSLDLYLRFRETSIPWRAITEIRELEQT